MIFPQFLYAIYQTTYKENKKLNTSRIQTVTTNLTIQHTDMLCHLKHRHAVCNIFIYCNMRSLWHCGVHFQGIGCAIKLCKKKKNSITQHPYFWQKKVQTYTIVRNIFYFQLSVTNISQFRNFAKSFSKKKTFPIFFLYFPANHTRTTTRHTNLKTQNQK